MTVASVGICSVIDRIIEKNEKLRAFWSHSYGWAPESAASLLNRSRLDRQVSLSYCLKDWFEPCDQEKSEGRLILAWANLGSLVEGSMKFFLSVYHSDYVASPITKGAAAAVVACDETQLEQLRQYFCKVVWTVNEKDEWNSFVGLVQKRRNAIHAYKDKDIGAWHEFELAVQKYLEFVTHIDHGIPWPDYSPEQYS